MNFLNSYFAADKSLSQREESFIDDESSFLSNFRTAQSKSSSAREKSQTYNSNTKKSNELLSSDFPAYKTAKDKESIAPLGKKVRVPSIVSYSNDEVTVSRDCAKDILSDGLYCYNVWIKEDCKIIKGIDYESYAFR